MILDRAGGAVRMKAALGNLREDPHHGVRPLLVVQPDHPEHVQPEAAKFVVEE